MSIVHSHKKRGANAPLFIIGFACQDLGLDHTGGLADESQHLFDMDGQIHSFSGDGNNCAAVGGHDRVDGSDVCLQFREQVQQVGQIDGETVLGVTAYTAIASTNVNSEQSKEYAVAR